MTTAIIHAPASLTNGHMVFEQSQQHGLIAAFNKPKELGQQTLIEWADLITARLRQLCLCPNLIGGLAPVGDQIARLIVDGLNTTSSDVGAIIMHSNFGHNTFTIEGGGMWPGAMAVIVDVVANHGRLKSMAQTVDHHKLSLTHALVLVGQAEVETIQVESGSLVIHSLFTLNELAAYDADS